MYQLTIESFLISFLSVLTIVLIVFWRSAVSSRKSDLAYIYHVIEAINKGVELPPYGCAMDKHVKFLLLYVKRVAEEYKRLKDAEKAENEKIAELVWKWMEDRPKIIPTSQPIDSITWLTNFFQGLDPSFMVPDVPQEKAESKVKHNGSVEKPKAYFYAINDGFISDRVKCQLIDENVVIGSLWCTNDCQYFIAKGRNQKGWWLKCSQLNKALGK